MNKTMNHTNPKQKQTEKEIDLEEYLKNPLERFKLDLKLSTSTELNTEGYSEFSHNVYGFK